MALEGVLQIFYFSDFHVERWILILSIDNSSLVIVILRRGVASCTIMAAKDPLINCMTSGPSNRGLYHMIPTLKDNKLLVSNETVCPLCEIICYVQFCVAVETL